MQMLAEYVIPLDPRAKKNGAAFLPCGAKNADLL